MTTQEDSLGIRTQLLEALFLQTPFTAPDLYVGLRDAEGVEVDVPRVPANDWTTNTEEGLVWMSNTEEFLFEDIPLLTSIVELIFYDSNVGGNLVFSQPLIVPIETLYGTTVSFTPESVVINLYHQ